MINTTPILVNEEMQKLENGFSALTAENIGYEKGAKLVKNYCDQNTSEIIAHFVDKNMIEEMLAQPGVVGISIISGSTASGEFKPVLVGVNENGNYITNITTVDLNGEMQKQKGIVASGVISPGTGTNQTVGCGWY